MELRADPHRVRIDQLAYYEGATVATSLGADATTQICGIREFFHQFDRVIQMEEQVRLILGFTPCCLVEVIQAVAPFGILLDGDVVDGDGVRCLHDH